jgi:hypothetical protein
MEKNTLITIFIFFLLSNQLYKIFWEILKALLYLYAIVLGLNYINPAVAGTLKKYLSFVLQFDQNIFQVVLGNISGEIKKFFGENLPVMANNINTTLPQFEQSLNNNIKQVSEEQYQEEQEEQYQEEQEEQL